MFQRLQQQQNYLFPILPELSVSFFRYCWPQVKFCLSYVSEGE